MYEIKVKGMSCGSCANSLTYALKSIDPKVELSVDIKTQLVRVNSNKSEKEISAIIEEAGYPVIESKKVG